MPSVLGRSATSLSGPAACARARALLGSGCTIRSPPFLSDHRPRRPLRTSQPDPENEAASLGGALLRIASALEQKHDSGGTVHDAFEPNPGVANSQEEYDAIFGDQPSRVFSTCQAPRSGADSESCENSEGVKSTSPVTENHNKNGYVNCTKMAT